MRLPVKMRYCKAILDCPLSQQNFVNASGMIIMLKFEVCLKEFSKYALKRSSELLILLVCVNWTFVLTLAKVLISLDQSDRGTRHPDL